MDDRESFFRGEHDFLSRQVHFFPHVEKVFIQSPVAGTRAKRIDRRAKVVHFVLSF